MINPLDLTGKQILIFDTSSKIGQTIVEHLSSLGSTIITVNSSDNVPAYLNNICGSKVVSQIGNIYDNSEIEPFFKKLSETFGVLDGFVFCGGIGGVRPLSLTKQKFLSELFNANLFSFIEIVRCITKKDSFSKGGSIVALSSVSSVKGLKSKIGYCATKAALDSAIRCMAAELGDKSIRVNSIQKGWVESDMEKDFIKNNRELDQDNDFKKQILGAIKPSEIAIAVAFLLSDATKSITGTSLLIDGGYTL
jgi:NAD(P)-dependent dehydrogenase (short-subunit alcohol dehydrogenase family)